jgi:hypothetical protein
MYILVHTPTMRASKTALTWERIDSLRKTVFDTRWNTS